MLPPPRLIYASGENGHWIRSLSFAADGAHLASVADDGLVRVWDLENDQAEATVAVEHGLCCSFSSTGHLLAVGTRGGAASIYETRSCIKPLLFLCRTVIRRFDALLSSQFNSTYLPKHLVNYIHYKDLE
jgi:WD repeat/SOCS box-containing protein 1